jgi:hypothetical protein
MEMIPSGKNISTQYHRHVRVSNTSYGDCILPCSKTMDLIMSALGGERYGKFTSLVAHYSAKQGIIDYSGPTF